MRLYSRLFLGIQPQFYIKTSDSTKPTLSSVKNLAEFMLPQHIKKDMEKSIYDFVVTDMKKNPVKLDIYKGKVLLIVNTATGCGFTPQYKGLENLYRLYKDYGLVILGFPCNQFGNQAPGTEEEISDFCELNYGVTFPQFAKIDVNGKDADPLYKWLKEQKKGILGSKSIKWNFTKFLIDRNGKVVRRFSPSDTPEEIEPAIKELLG